LDNWFKNLQAKKLPHYNSRQLATVEEEKKKEAVNNVYRYYKTLSGSYLEMCQKIRDYCKSRKQNNPAFEAIGQAYRDLIQVNLEDSFLVKMVAHTFPQKLARFFLGDTVAIPKIEVPRILVPTRDLDYDLSKHLNHKRLKRLTQNG
jgi:hypothetical protein